MCFLFPPPCGIELHASWDGSSRHSPASGVGREGEGGGNLVGDPYSILTSLIHVTRALSHDAMAK